MGRPPRDREPLPRLIEARRLSRANGHHISSFVDDADLVAECRDCKGLVAVDVNEDPGINGQLLTEACA